MLPNFEANWRTGTFRIAFSIIVTRIPTGGQDHWFSLFGSRVVKIFIVVQQHHLKLRLSYSVILRYLPSFLANQNIQKVFSANINCCIALGGQVPVLIQYGFVVLWNPRDYTSSETKLLQSFWMHNLDQLVSTRVSKFTYDSFIHIAYDSSNPDHQHCSQNAFTSASARLG